MTQIEKLKARLATATDTAQRQALADLIRTLEAAPQPVSDSAPDLNPATDPRLRFLNSEQAKFWGPIILGQAKAYAKPEDPVDPLEDPCKRRR